MKSYLAKIPAYLYYLIGGGSILTGVYLFIVQMSSKNAPLWQELSAGLILAGLVAIWCGRDYERSTTLRFFSMVFFGLLALIHWLDFFRGNVALSNAIFNTFPLAGLLLAEFIICELVKPVGEKKSDE
ncbi:MAG: hypothetical protein ACE5FF_01805 [Saprospiraceae bacterium]